jgi:predicted nuclease with TOPRIM domain
MGKHDIKSVSNEEYLQGRIKNLEARLVFVNETNDELKRKVNRLNKWISELEAAAEDKVTALEAENAKLRGKILKLVDDYVGRE